MSEPQRSLVGSVLTTKKDMKNIQNGILIAVTLLFLTGSNPAQIAQNQEKAKSVAISDTQPTVKALPSDREKELLERIERLEKRLTELEKSAKTPLTTDQRVDTVAANSLNISAPVTATPPGGSIPTKDANAAVQDKPKLLEEGIIPHSIRIPGTDLSLKFSGYVKADFIQDFQGIGNRSQFATNSIPIDGTSSADIGAGTNIQARESRISLELVGEPGKHQFRAYVEGDFYGDGNAFRLRHAYGEYGGLLAGQTWSTFMDVSARPRTLDYEGPDGEIFVRQAMVRWTQAFAKNWKFAVAVEEPTVQIATPTGFTGSARGNVPDFTGFVRHQQKRFHFQIAAIARNLRFDGTGSTPDRSTIGWGLNSTFKVNAVGKDQLMGQFAFGSGINRYIESMGGQNVDAVFGSANSLVALPSRAGLIGYERHWTPKLMSVLTYSIADLSYNTGLSGSTIKRTQDGRVNLIWTPFRLVDLGAEFMWGRRDNQDGTHGDATRIMFSTIYRFN